MSSNKPNSKSNLFTSSKQSFFKASDHNDMLQTQHSNFSSSKEQVMEYSKDDLYFEEDCLMKIKNQRLKIQQLSHLYHKTQEQLKRQQDKTRRLQIKTQNYQQLKTIKLKYLTLTKQFQTIISQNCILQDQCSKLQHAFKSLTQQHQNSLKSHLLQKRKLKQQFNFQINQYEQIIKTKNDQISRNITIFEMKQKQYLDKVQKMDLMINQLKNDIVEMKRIEGQQLHKLQLQLSKKDVMIQKLKTSSSNIKDENSTLRQQLKQVENQFIQKQQQWLQAQDDFIYEINSLKRKINDFNNQQQDNKHSICMLTQSNQQLKQHVEVMKKQLKQTQQQSYETISKLTHGYQRKIEELKHQVDELKESVKELLQVKTIYNKQNEQLKGKIQKDEQEKMKRRRMIRSELREIEMMENSINRVL